MPLHLPQHTQDQLFFDHDMRTDSLDFAYRFNSVLAPKYWSPISKGVMIYRAYKGMTKRRFGKAFTSLNF